MDREHYEISIICIDSVQATSDVPALILVLIICFCKRALKFYLLRDCELVGDIFVCVDRTDTDHGQVLLLPDLYSRDDFVCK